MFLLQAAEAQAVFRKFLSENKHQPSPAHSLPSPSTSPVHHNDAIARFEGTTSPVNRVLFGDSTNKSAS
jgi:hypothetical protein